MRQLLRSIALVALILATAGSPPGPSVPVARAAVASAEPISIDDLAVIDLYYALRLTSFDGMTLPPGFSAPHLDVFESPWHSASNPGPVESFGQVRVDVVGPHAESLLTYEINESAEEQRHYFEQEEKDYTDVSDRLAALGQPYPAKCLVVPRRPIDTDVRSRCVVLIDRVVISSLIVDTGDNMDSVTFDDALRLVASSIDSLRAAADTARHGTHAPSAEQTLADARKLYDALLATPVDPSELTEGITSAVVGADDKDHTPPAALDRPGMVGVVVTAQSAPVDLTYWIYRDAFARRYFEMPSYRNTTFTGESHPTELERPAYCINMQMGTDHGTTHCEALIDPVTVVAESTVQGDVKHGDEALARALLRFGIAHLERVKLEARS